jgi:hypothetical protein
MNVLTRAARIVRHESDPRVLKSGPSSLGGADQLARALGWLSIGLGITQLLAAPRYTRALGLRGRENHVRACGVREIGHGILSLSTQRRAGLWSRVGGDALDIAALSAAMRRRNPKRDNVAIALALVLGITALDFVGTQALAASHGRRKGEVRDYRGRSGFPQGVERSRGLAAGFQQPVGMKISQQSGDTLLATNRPLSATDGFGTRNATSKRPH